MLEAGGLGAKIDKIAGAYRGNPEALQKKTKLQPDLMEALALQKVMSEKATAKQQLELSQQQDAGSVVEQMEQKLVGMNKEELTAQTAGIMGERNKKRNQQLSAAKPPQQQGQRPPMQMAQGAPQGLPAAPRPPTQFAAQGGIIGYSAGGITDLDVEKWLEDNPNVFPQGSDSRRREVAVKALNKENAEKRKSAPVSAQERAEFRKNNPNVFPEATDFTQIDKIIQKEKFGERTLSAETEPEPELAANVGTGGLKTIQSNRLRDAMEVGGGGPQAGSISGIASEAKKKQDAIAQQSQQSAVPLKPGAGVLKPGGIPSVPDMNRAGVLAPPVDPNAAPAGAPPALDVDQQLQEIINTPATDFSTISKTQATDAMGEKFNTKLDKRMDVDPEAKKKAEVEKLSGPSIVDGVETGGYDRQGKAEGLAKYLKQKEDLDKKMLDPAAVDKRRTQAYMDGLITGGTGRTGTAARSQFDANIAKSEQDSITQQKAMRMEDMKFDVEIADKIGAQATKVFEIYSKDVAEAMNTAATIGTANLSMFYKEAKMAYDSNQDGIKNKIDAIKTSTAANLNKLIQSSASFQDISSAANSLYDKIGKLKIEFKKQFAVQLLVIEEDLANPKTKPDRRKQLIAQKADFDMQWEATSSFIEGDKFLQIYKKLLEESASNNGVSSELTTQIENMTKELTGTSQEQVKGLANARQQQIISNYVPTD